MKISIQNVIEDAKRKLGGYLALYSYHLMNLVIKADPVALLGVNVKTDEGEGTIERVAHIFHLDDYTFVVFPKDKDLLLDIGKGILEVHPEMKQEIKKLNELTGEETSNEENSESVILVSMPEVNEDRYKALKEGVDAYTDVVDIKVKSTYDAYKIKLETYIAGSSDKEKEEAKAALEELHEMAVKSIEDFKGKKLAEIEEAYQNYLTIKEEEKTRSQNEEKAHGKKAGMSLKMLGEEDDE